MKVVVVRTARNTAPRYCPRPQLPSIADLPMVRSWDVTPWIRHSTLMLPSCDEGRLHGRGAAVYSYGRTLDWIIVKHAALDLAVPRGLLLTAGLGSAANEHWRRTPNADLLSCFISLQDPLILRGGRCSFSAAQAHFGWTFRCVSAPSLAFQLLFATANARRCTCADLSELVEWAAHFRRASCHIEFSLTGLCFPSAHPAVRAAWLATRRRSASLPDPAPYKSPALHVLTLVPHP
jgi:hypothetical protein